jgi:hypothetical protein
MKLVGRRVLAAIRNHSASGAAVLRLGQHSILISSRVFGRLWRRATSATMVVTTLIMSRVIPAFRAHVRRLKPPQTSCLDLHPSEVAPPELRWRQHLRDLVIELGSAPDPGEWMFCADQQGQWVWEYIVDREVVARSSSVFRDLTQCLDDAKAHGFSSLFAFYSTRHDVPKQLRNGDLSAVV